MGLYRDLGDKGGMASALNNEGNVAHNLGDFVTARAIYEESLALRRELGDRQGVATSLINLGSVAQKQGDFAAAHRMHAESLTLFRELGHRVGIAYALGAFGSLASAQQQYSRATRLWGAAHTLRELLDAPLSPSESAEYDQEFAHTRSALGETDFRLAWSEGSVFTLDHAIEYALKERL